MVGLTNPDSYDGLRMLHNQIHGSSATGESSQAKGDDVNTLINPKLRQIYEAKSKIEPFYSGGKIVALPANTFACLCGPVVKIVSTEEAEMMSEENRHFRVVDTYETELDEIISFDACPFSYTLITAHKSLLIRLFNLLTRKEIRSIKSLHSAPITNITIHTSLSGSLLQLYLNANKKKDPQSRQERGKKYLTENGLANRLTWATSSGNSLKLWNAGGNVVSKIIYIPNIAAIGLIKWDPNSTQFFCAERNIYIIEFNNEVKRFEIAQELKGHYSQVTGIELAPPATKLMVSGSRDKTIILWTAKKNAQKFLYEKTRTFVVGGAIESMTLLQGTFLFLSTGEGVEEINLQTLKARKLKGLINEGGQNALQFYPPLLQGYEEEKEDFYATSTSLAIFEVRKKGAALKIQNQFVGSLEEVLDVKFWEETKVAVATNTAVIKIYELSSGNCQFLQGHTDIVLSLASYKSWLLSSSKDNSIILWKSGEMSPFRVLTGHIASVSSVSFDPSSDEQSPLFYSVSEDNFMKAWTIDSCSNSTIAHEAQIHSVDCSPNGQLIATGSRDKSCKIWNKSLKLLATLKGHKKSIWDAKFSKWDQLVLTASADTFIKIWNLSNYECIKTLQAHTSSVLKAIFINNGLQIVSSGSDGTLRSWDLRTSLPLSTTEVSDGKTWGLDSSSDGSLLVTGSADSLLVLWADVTENRAKEQSERRKRVVMEEQRLANVVQSGKWETGIELALKLERPFALLKIVRSVPMSQRETLKSLIGRLSQKRLQSLLSYIEKWNTNTRTSSEAQLLLQMILDSYTPSQLKFIHYNTLIPYTEKHEKRLSRIRQQSALVTYLGAEKMDGIGTKSGIDNYNGLIGQESKENSDIKSVEIKTEVRDGYDIVEVEVIEDFEEDGKMEEEEISEKKGEEIKEEDIGKEEDKIKEGEAEEEVEIKEEVESEMENN